METLVTVFEKIPPAAWAALLASIIAAFIAFIGVTLTNRSNNQRLRIQLEHDLTVKAREFQRERLEELYLLLEGWLNALCVYYLPYPYVMRGELTFNQALDQNIESAKSKPLDFKRLEMIVDLYFPQLRTSLDRVHAVREEANKIIERYKKQYKERSTDGSAFLQPFLDADRSVETRGVELKGEIIKIARETYNLSLEPTR